MVSDEITGVSAYVQHQTDDLAVGEHYKIISIDEEHNTTLLNDDLVLTTVSKFFRLDPGYFYLYTRINMKL